MRTPLTRPPLLSDIPCAAHRANNLPIRRIGSSSTRNVALRPLRCVGRTECESRNTTAESRRNGDTK